MEHIFTNVSKLLNTSTRLEVHSSLTQNLVGSENIVLWNTKPLSSIDTETYIEFKDALKKTGSKYYTLSTAFSYVDFCIALLSSLDYSLNHKVTKSISDRTFTAAWRSIYIIGNTGTNKVSSWVNSFIADRTAAGYCNALNVRLDNITISTPFKEDIEIQDDSKDSDLLSSITTSDNVVRIPYYNEDTSSTYQTGNIFNSTLTPEGQLYDLIVAHNAFNNKLF